MDGPREYRSELSVSLKKWQAIVHEFNDVFTLRRLSGNHGDKSLERYLAHYSVTSRSSS